MIGGWVRSMQPNPTLPCSMVTHISMYGVGSAGVAGLTTRPLNALLNVWLAWVEGGADLGGYWWSPTYSTWGPTIVSFSFSVSAQLTIFSNFSGPELPEPF